MATLSILGLYDMTPDLFKGFIVPTGLDRDAAIFDICTECAELEILYPDGDFMTQAISMWCKMRAESWNRMYKALVTSEYSPIENTDRQTEISDTRQTDGTESGSSESNSTATQADTNESSGSGTTTHSVTGFNSDTFANDDKDAVTNQASESANSTATGKTTNSSSRTSGETETLSHTEHTHGNIGVTTNQQMITDEIVLRRKYDMYSLITREFKDKFCLEVF